MADEWNERDYFDALCESFLYCGSRNMKDLPAMPERAAFALEALLHLRTEYEKAMSSERESDALKILAAGRAIWAIFSGGFDWLRETPGIPENLGHVSGELARALLNFELTKFSSVIPHVHGRRGLGSIPVMLPWWLFDALLSGLEGLDSGEVSALLEPKKTERAGKGQRHSSTVWDRYRIRALHHVFFLIGQGIKKGVAYARVATAIGASDKTMLKWVQKLPPSQTSSLELARAAGELLVQMQADPMVGRPGGPEVEYETRALLHELQEEPLAAFGERYRSAPFARRHNQ